MLCSWLEPFLTNLNDFIAKKTFRQYRILQVYVRKHVYGAQQCPSRSIEYLIENSMKFHLYILTLKPTEKGSNRLQIIL